MKMIDVLIMLALGQCLGQGYDELTTGARRTENVYAPGMGGNDGLGKA